MTKNMAAVLFMLSTLIVACDQKQDLGKNGTCPANLSACQDRCVDTYTDPANCGSCGQACSAGQVCAYGQCASSCPAGLTNCDGACVNTAGDDLYCGSCSNECTDGQHCGGQAGPTQCYSCQPGETFCYATSRFWACSDLKTDNLNCGTCNNRCSLQQRCINGTCQ